MYNGGEMVKIRRGVYYAVFLTLLMVVGEWKGVAGFTEVTTIPSSFITSVPSLLPTARVCPPGTVFCLASGQCVQKDGGCSFLDPTIIPPTTSRCQEDEVFCLFREACVPRQVSKCNERDGESTITVQGKCRENEVFCLASEKCLPKEGCGTGIEQDLEPVKTKCDTNEYFCLEQGRCVAISGRCENEEVTPSPGTEMHRRCGENEYFCLQQGRCVALSGGCEEKDFTPTPGTETHRICGEKEYFCLQRNRCVSRVGPCDYSPDRSCGVGEVYCTTVDRCIPSGESCEDNRKGTHKCQQDEYFCLQQNKCVPKSGECDMVGPPGTTTAVPPSGGSCREGQVFCLATGRCVEETCSGTEDQVLPTSFPASTSSPTTAVDRVLLLDKAVTLYDNVQFRLLDYLAKMIEGRQLGQPEQLTIQLHCDRDTGVLFYAGRTVLGERGVGVAELITVTTDGREKGVVTCRLLSLPPDIAMGYQYHIGVVAVPESLTPIVSMVMSSMSIMEGNTLWVLDEWDKVFLVSISDEAPETPRQKEVLSSRTMSEIYNEGLQSVAERAVFPLHVSLYQVPLDLHGLPVATIVTMSDDGSHWRRAATRGMMLDVKGYEQRSRSLYVKIHSTFSGDLHFILSPNTGNQFVFTLKVLAVNNAPYLISPEKTLDILSSVLVQPYSGSHEFTAGEISDLVFLDEDGDNMGLALLGAVSDELGTWEYNNGDGWRAVPISGHLTVTRQQNVSAVLLSHTDKLKFVPSVSDLWSTREALKKTKLYSLAWDGSDMAAREKSHVKVYRCSGRMKMCGEGGSSAYSEEVLPLFINKAGCDGQAGSQLVEDLCGVCGGHDDCVDCNGNLSGGAVIDSCGDCTEGNTGRTKDHQMDCRGQCGLNYFDSTLNMCLPNNVDLEKLMTLFQECDGQIDSDAYINKCGYCVLGNTTLNETHGEDQCGVCDGENRCKDCAGVPHGESVIDFCGKCVLRHSEDYNQDCYEGMGHINQTMFGANGQKGVEMTAYTMAQEGKENRPSALHFRSCGMFKTSYWDQEIELTVVSYDNNTGLIVARTRELTAYDIGNYDIGCLTSDEGIDTIKSVAYTRIILFGPVQVRAVIPEQVKVQEGTKVTIRGIGIYNTGYIRCAIKCPYVERRIGCFTTKPKVSGFMVFPAKRLDATTCECDLTEVSKITRPVSHDITVLLEPLSETLIPGLKFVKLHMKAPAPRLVSAWFDMMYCSVTVQFDVPVEGPQSCSELFEDRSFQKLGKNARCRFMGNKLMVMLRKGKFSLRPGEELFISNTTIQKLFSEENEPSFASGNVTVRSPKQQVQISAELLGGGVIGSCDPFELFLKKSGSLGCVDIIFNWTVASNDSNPSMTVLAELAILQNRLNNMPTSQWRVTGRGSEIFPGSTYVFTATITNTMDHSSTSLSAHVTRSQSIKPVSVKLQLMSGKHPDPQRTLKMVAVVTPSSCSGINMLETNFLYQWTSSSADVVIRSVMELPFAVIRRGSLRGGSVYTVTVTVFKQNDESMSDEASVTFKTVSQPLEIRVPPYIQSLSSTAVVLDASRSTDPDNIPDKPRFFWACVKESIPGVPFYITRNSSELMLESLVRPSSPETPILTIPPDVMPIGRYIWNVTMMKGKRSTSISVIMEIADDRAPLVVIDTTDLTINTGESVRLNSVISTYNKKPVTIFWECGQLEGYDYVTLDNYTSFPDRLQQKSAEALSNYVFSLYLDKGLPSGGIFPLQVTAIAGDQMLSRTELVKVSINAPPLTGEVKILPLNGTALVTKFEVMFGEGWIDPEGDKVNFFVHTQKVGEEKICRMNARSRTDIVSYDLMLGAGEFMVHIEACDMLQACVIYTVPDQIYVIDKEMSEAELITAVNDVTQLLKTDMDQAVGMTVSLISLMGKEKNNSQALGGVVNDVAYNLLSSSSAEFAPDEAVTVMDTANTILEPIAKEGMLTNKVIEEGLSKANQMASTVRSQSSPGGQKKRRRRAVDPDTITITQSMSESKAETLLTTYSLLYTGKTIEQITTQQATDYLSALDSVKIGLCAGITYAEDGVVVDNDLTTLRVQMRTTETLDTDVIPVTCENCTVNHTAYVTYGAEMRELYHHWNCSTDLQCYGACFTSAQMTMDMVTATSPERFSFDLVRRSDLISLQLVNPATYDMVTVGDLSTPVMVQVPIAGDYNESAHSLQCNLWSGSNWTKHSCASSSPEYVRDTFQVNCSCTRLGIISVFEGPAVSAEITTQITVMPETTDMTNIQTTIDQKEMATFEAEKNVEGQITVIAITDQTSESTTDGNGPPVGDPTTPVNSINVPAYAGKVYILFALHDNFATTVAGQENSFRLHIMQILTSYLRIPASRITNLRVEEVKNDDDDAGSITIKFEVFSRALDSEPTMGEIIFQLREAITTGSLVVTSTTGQRLVVDTNSFAWSTSELQTEIDSGTNYTMFIVSGAVGAFVLIIIMTGIVIYLIKTKANKSQQVTQSPAPYGPNMQGVDVPRPIVGKPNNTSNNWMETDGTTDLTSSVSESTDNYKSYSSKPLSRLPPIQ